MKRTTFLKIALPLVALVLVATGCRGKTFSYNKSIKQSSVACKFFGNYDADGGYPVSFHFDCDFDYTGSGEHPYLMLWLSGCSLRVNGTDDSNWTDTRQCLGDGIDKVKLQLCQTRNGVLPDDCTDKRTWDYT